MNDGLHLMHERYLSNEPHGIKFLDHEAWKLVRDRMFRFAEWIYTPYNQKHEIAGIEFKIEPTAG